MSCVWFVAFLYTAQRPLPQLRGLCHPRTKNGHFFCDDCSFPGFSPIFRGFGQSLQKISAILLRGYNDYYLPPVMMPDSLGRNLLRSQYARMPAAIINAISVK